MLTFAEFFAQKRKDSPAGVDVYVADLTGHLRHISEELESASIPFAEAKTLEQISQLIDSLHKSAHAAHGKGGILEKETFLFLNSTALNKTASEDTFLQLTALSRIGRHVKLNILTFMV